VDAGADAYAKLVDQFDDRQRAADGTGRRIEDGEKPVAGGVDLATVKTAQLASDQLVVLRQQ
jgi:hypothetical protein